MFILACRYYQKATAQMQQLKMLYPNTTLLRPDPKKAESLFKDLHGLRPNDSNEHLEARMTKRERNPPVFNHARGVDQITKDHRTVFHNIFEAGARGNTVLTDSD